jgi:hypothetical protein
MVDEGFGEKYFTMPSLLGEEHGSLAQVKTVMCQKLHDASIEKANLVPIFSPSRKPNHKSS